MPRWMHCGGGCGHDYSHGLAIATLACRRLAPAAVACATFVAVEFLHVQLPVLVLVLAPISIALAWFEGVDGA